MEFPKQLPKKSPINVSQKKAHKISENSFNKFSNEFPLKCLLIFSKEITTKIIKCTPITVAEKNCYKVVEEISIEVFAVLHKTD